MLPLLHGRYVGINGSGPPPPWAEWPQLIIGQAEAILRKYDSDRSGGLGFDEFVSACAELNILTSR